MARKRASMREGPLAELFCATEAAQRQAEQQPPAEPEERTVEHVPTWDELSAESSIPEPPSPRPDPMPPPTPPEPRPDPLPNPQPPTPRPEPPRPEIRAVPPVTHYAEPPLPEPPARLHWAPRSEAAAYLAVIRVVGVGGAGLNAINRMVDAGINQVEFVAINTDIQQLQMSDAETKIHIGRELTQGLGSGADPDVGRAAADESYDQIKHALRG